MEFAVLGEFHLSPGLAAVRELCEGLAAGRELTACCQMVCDFARDQGAPWAAIWGIEGEGHRLISSASGPGGATVPPGPDHLEADVNAIPLTRAGELLGTLAIGRHEGPADSLASWYPVASALSLAWSCIRQDAELEDTRRQLGKRELDLGTLFGISQELNSSLSSETIGQTLLLSAMGHCGIRAGMVTGVRDGEHRILAQQGVTEAYRESPTLRAAKAGERFTPDDPQSRPWAFFVAMHHGGAMSGLLALGPKLTGRAFSREEVSFLHALAEQASVALANATYCEELEETLERERRIFTEKEKMRRYLSSAAIAHVEGDEDTHEAQTVWATVLFADVRGFTALAEKYPARQVVALLNAYMSGMAEVILAHGGVVDKFMGDGIMAFFQPQYPEDNEAFRAVTCAIAMRQAVARMNQEGVFGEGMELRVGIGLNSGEAVAGNIGSLDRMDFTLIGDTVNLSARLESAAGPGQILLSTSTAERVGQLARTEYFDTLVLKGKAAPLDVFQVPG